MPDRGTQEGRRANSDRARALVRHTRGLGRFQLRHTKGGSREQSGVLASGRAEPETPDSPVPADHQFLVNMIPKAPGALIKGDLD